MLDKDGSVMGLEGGKRQTRFYAFCVFMVEVMGMFCYFSGFRDRSGMVGLDIGCDFCLVKVNAIFYLQIVHLPLIIGSPV
jgi:hypothetical protein